jgi:uncharacterized protein YbcI
MTTEPEPELSPFGESLQSKISNEIVHAKKLFFGKGPQQAKTYLMDDLCFVVLRGGLTRAEETMLEFGHPDQVRAFRQLFENEMADRLMGIVRDLTGREVATYQSQIMFDPDVIVEMFVFADRAPEDAVEATARDQLADDDA